MKRFICTADIHVWLRREVPEEWQINRYQMLFRELIFLCRKHDAGLIIAGDLFEKSDPSLEELELVLKFFHDLKSEGIYVALVSGNHETIGNGIDTFQFLDTGPGRTIDVDYGTPWHTYYPQEDATIFFVNHCDLSQFMAEELPQERKANLQILVSHFRCSYNQYVREEIDVAKLLEPFDLCIAGDIHAPFNDGKLWYTNNPVNKEFQKSADCGVLLLEIDSGKYQLTRIPLQLPALIQLSSNADEALPETNDTDYYRINVTGTHTELREVEIDKPNVKVNKVPRVEEALTLAVDEEVATERSIEDELVSYLRDIGYSDDYVSEMMSALREVA